MTINHNAMRIKCETDVDVNDPLYTEFVNCLETLDGCCLDNPEERERVARALVAAVDRHINQMLGV